MLIYVLLVVLISLVSFYLVYDFGETKKRRIFVRDHVEEVLRSTGRSYKDRIPGLSHISSSSSSSPISLSESISSTSSSSSEDFGERQTMLGELNEQGRQIRIGGGVSTESSNLAELNIIDIEKMKAEILKKEEAILKEETKNKRNTIEDRLNAIEEN